MQVPILNGIYTDEAPDFRTSYPRNMVPVPKENGISKGYLRPGDGIVQFAVGPGLDRGGINWNGVHYRVMGSKLVRVSDSGVVSDSLGSIDGSDPVTFDYSFDYLAIRGGVNLYYFDGVLLTQVTDPQLGDVVDFVWIDGYFMTTDGTSLIVTDINDPFSINPLRYGSSEADPDPVTGLVKIRNEIYALNRYTIEVFDNVGGDFVFPFQRIEGAQVQRGAVGTHCKCNFMDTVAFIGSGRNESPAVWMASNGQSAKISTREIDVILQNYTEEQLAVALLESRIDKAHQHLYVHLPDQTLVYDAAASSMLQEPVWFFLISGVTGLAQYRARNLVWINNKWLAGDPTTSRVGELVDTVSTHYGETIGWEFGTTILYNDGLGALFHEIELVALPGRVALGADPVIWSSSSIDGESFTRERPCSAGKQGQRTKRLIWIGNGSMRNWRVEKFRGTSDAHISFVRLEIKLEPLHA